MTIVSLSANNPVVTLIREIKSTNGYGTFIHGGESGSLVGTAVADAVTIIAAQTDAQTGNAVVVHTGADTKLIGNLVFRGRLRAALNPVATGKLIAVQTCEQLHLIAPVFLTPPERDTCLMPGTGQDGVLAFRTIDRKKLQRLVMGIGESYRDYDMTGLDIGPARKGLLNPELLQLYLTTLLGLLFPFCKLVGLQFLCRARSAMLKLYLCTKGPATTEVVTQVDYCMGNVQTVV